MRLVLFCLIVFFIQCSKKTMNTSLASGNENTLNKNIEKEVGTAVEKSFNTSKTHLLAYRIKDAKNSFRSYAVFEVSSGNLVQKGNYTPGYVKWISDVSLELLSVPGTIPIGKSITDYTTIIYLTNEK
jgi:hypothetical protein